MSLKIAMLSLHSSPVGTLGTKDTGGMSVYILEMVHYLANVDCCVDIFTRHYDGQPTITYLYPKIRLIRLPVGPKYPIPKISVYKYLEDFCSALEYFFLKDSISYNLIHSHYWISGCVGQKLANRSQCPHIITFHTIGAVKNIIDLDIKESEVRIEKEKNLVHDCHRILVGCKLEMEYTVRLYNAKEDKIGLVPGGVNLEKFYPLSKKDVRLDLELDIDEIVILFVGRFDLLKGIDQIIEAVNLLKYNFWISEKVKLVLVGGDGEHSYETKRLRAKVLKLDIYDNVEFIGCVHSDMMPLFYSAADVVVVASAYESFGLVALEALACGTPVVSTKVGDIERVVKHGYNGFLVNSSSPKDLAKGILSTLTKNKSVQDIRKTVLEFNWTVAGEKLVREYNNATMTKVK